MSLTQKYTHHHLSPLLFNPSKTRPTSIPPFEETLIARLKSFLRSLSSPSLSLSSLAAAVDLLSSTLSSAASLLSDPNLSSRSESDSAALSAHLDASLSLLDSLNSLSSLLDRLSRRRLHLSFALHLLSSSSPTRKARDSIAEWERRSQDPLTIRVNSADLIRTDPPRGKISAVRRAIYAVEAVSGLVIGLVSTGLGVEADLDRIPISGEFAWAEAFNGILTAVKWRRLAEIEAVDASVERLTEVMDGGDGELTEGLRVEAEKRTEELTEELDRLGNAVNGVFKVALGMRSTVLQSFRISPKSVNRRIRM